MGGRGRTAVSPEVAGFLHHFWEMLAHIANTLIFFLVGLVIAGQLGVATSVDLVIVVAAYGVVVAVRFVVIFASSPLLNIGALRMSVRDATLVSWGGLRGAVSLALALILSQYEAIDPELRRQILLATGGVVMLSILINGTTTGHLLRVLGFNRKSLGEQLASLNAEGSALEEVRKRVTELSHARDLRTLPWSEVDKELVERLDGLGERVEGVEKALANKELGDDERLAELWRQALRIEREAYWRSFAEGTLGAKAVAILSQEIAQHGDRISSGQLDPPRSREPVRRRSWRRAVRRTFHRTALAYDIARAESAAAEKVLSTLDQIADSDVAEKVARHYRRYYRSGKERIEEMRVNVPEVVQALEKRLVHRIALNVERDEVTRITERGAFEPVAGQTALDSIKTRMKRLHFGPVQAQLPSVSEMCRKVPLFRGLDDPDFESISTNIEQHVLEPGEVLLEKGERGASVFIIVRGAVHVLSGSEDDAKILDILGAGEVFGEIAFLTGARRTATIRAATTATLAEVDRSALESLMERDPAVAEKLWDAYAVHQFDNLVRPLRRFEHLSTSDRSEWIGGRPHVLLQPGEALEAGEAVLAFVVDGSLSSAGARYEAPALVNIRDAVETPVATDAARVVVLPPRV